MTKTFDSWLERVLLIQSSSTPYQPSKSFGLALFISATRCLLQYIFLPFLLPLVGLSAQVPVWVSLLLSAVAFVFLVSSLRRFWKFKHPRRYSYLPLALLKLIVLMIFVLSDLNLIRLQK